MTTATSSITLVIDALASASEVTRPSIIQVLRECQ